VPPSAGCSTASVCPPPSPARRTAPEPARPSCSSSSSAQLRSPRSGQASFTAAPDSALSAV
jgi:hypothetical protein